MSKENRERDLERLLSQALTLIRALQPGPHAKQFIDRAEPHIAPENKQKLMVSTQGFHWVDRPSDRPKHTR